MDTCIIGNNKSIGIDISKKKCDYCVLDDDGSVIERGQYPNTIQDAKRIAQEMAKNMVQACVDVRQSANRLAICGEPHMRHLRMQGFISCLPIHTDLH